MLSAIAYKENRAPAEALLLVYSKFARLHLSGKTVRLEGTYV